MFSLNVSLQAPPGTDNYTFSISQMSRWRRSLQRTIKSSSFSPLHVDGLAGNGKKQFTSFSPLHVDGPAGNGKNASSSVIYFQFNLISYPFLKFSKLTEIYYHYPLIFLFFP
jgi:hypothetical protein